jgi:hypothetical protein
MPFESGAIHAPQHLVDLCVAYNPRDDGYVRGAFFPRKDVPHETDLIATVNKADVLRLYDLDVSGRGEIPEITYRTGADQSYRCKPVAAKVEINPKDTKNADAAYRHEKRQTRQALISCGIRMEYLAVNQTLRQTSVMTQNKTFSSTTRWDAFGSVDSSPIEDLQAAVRVVRIKTGTSAGAKSRDGQGLIKVAMHEFTWMTLQQHPNVIDRVRFNTGQTGAILTKEILAKMLEIGEDDILIVSAQYTSSVQGPAVTDAYKGFIGSDVVVAMVDSDAENDQALGHEFVFDGLAGEDPFLVNKWRQQGVGVFLYTDYVGVACMVDYKATNAQNAGFLLQGVIDATDTNRYGNPTLID